MSVCAKSVFTVKLARSISVISQNTSTPALPSNSVPDDMLLRHAEGRYEFCGRTPTTC